MGLQVIDLDHFGRQRIPHFFVDSSRHFMSDLMSDHSFAETIHRQLRKSSLVALSRNKTGVTQCIPRIPVVYPLELRIIGWLLPHCYGFLMDKAIAISLVPFG